mmetsp:Transcript_7720/g.11050  ORF Transcript_7720/g.11050 Transcript_7720/m.11050 type:complete len:247 (-) Transcript_7720:68-808(-)
MLRFIACLLLTLESSCYALASTKLELKYFDLRGAAETARVLLAFGGNEDYVDTRFEITPGTFDSPSFKEAKESGDLLMNLGRAPVLVTSDGVTIGQSKAIERYLARQMGLMGQTPTEEALVDCVAEHCRDVKDAQMRKGFSMFAKDKTDEEKAALRKEWYETDMPTMLEKIDNVVKATGTEGFAVGSSPSLADVNIFSLLRDCMATDKEDVTKAAKNCDALNAIADAVANSPGVAKWLKERPETMF